MAGGGLVEMSTYFAQDQEITRSQLVSDDVEDLKRKVDECESVTRFTHIFDLEWSNEL